MLCGAGRIGSQDTPGALPCAFGFDPTDHQEKQTPLTGVPAFPGAAGGIRPALRGGPGRGSGAPPALHSLPLPFESHKNEKTSTPKRRCSFFGAAGGIRTHVPVRANGFRDRPVMTASIPLRIILIMLPGDNSRNITAAPLCPVAVPEIFNSQNARKISTAATPYCSLNPPQAALANVPASILMRIYLILFSGDRALYIIVSGRRCRGGRKLWRRHPDLNRRVEDLQSSALPLGYGAIGAGNEIRTRYLHLGKVALCQMSYARRWCLRPELNW